MPKFNPLSFSAIINNKKNNKKNMEKPRLNNDISQKLENNPQNDLSTLTAQKCLRELLPIARNIKRNSENYLGREATFIDTEFDQKIRKEIFIENEKYIANLFLENKEKNKNTIHYDRYKKSFIINTEKISIGEIVSSRRLGTEFYLDKSILESGEGKRLVKILKEKMLSYLIAEKYGKEMSKNLKEKFENRDALKSNAYKEIENRIGKNNEHLGIKAEKIFISLLEYLSIDRSDLRFEIHETNPYQDVENKIDFIIERKNKKRGVGIEESEKENLKTIGIQFTTALSKKYHKLDQINKAKERIKMNKDIDDIIYVEIDSGILRRAISDHEKSNNKFLNPVKFLPTNIKKQILENLFKEILNEEEIKSLEKNI